jgi:D-ribose pyranose/furanose isomerase RbsD
MIEFLNGRRFPPTTATLIKTQIRQTMKNNLQILAAIVAAMLATGCKQSSQVDENAPPSDTNSLSVTQQMQNAKEVATNAWQKVKDTTTNAWASVKEGTTNAWADDKESVQSAVDYTYDKKADFVAKANADLNTLDQKIQQLSDKAATASDSVKNEAQAKLQDLRDKRTELGKKLDAVKNASQADWNELKVGFQTSYDDAKTSLKQAWQWLNDKN